VRMLPKTACIARTPSAVVVLGASVPVCFSFDAFFVVFLLPSSRGPGVPSKLTFKARVNLWGHTSSVENKIALEMHFQQRGAMNPQRQELTSCFPSFGLVRL
jgi:hypothetical protein